MVLDTVVAGRPTGRAIAGLAALLMLGAAASTLARAAGPADPRTSLLRKATAPAASAGAVLGLLSPWPAAAFFAEVLPGVVLLRLFARTAEHVFGRHGRTAPLLTTVELTVLGTTGRLVAADGLPVGAVAAATGWVALGLGLADRAGRRWTGACPMVANGHPGHSGRTPNGSWPSAT
ncbi:hypothetical protein [Kitasatospora sp. NPDC048407]|uniref:hypothetical protein n=1 Tax=Kitasatospora sp. NPDC048407 TaxID=3364051 RepID=UPI0037206150